MKYATLKSDTTFAPRAFGYALPFLAVALTLLMPMPPVGAAEPSAKKSGWAASAHRVGYGSKRQPGKALAPKGTLAERYCQAVGDIATDARFAWQAGQLKKLAKELDDRRAILEERIAELKSWVERRDQFVELGTESLVKIFQSMRPDAASQQLSSVDEMTAAAIITKLKPRTASSILNEMETEKAARLASTIAGVARYARRQAAKKGGGT
ncbi:MAG: MotE family protein [Filomicrobium sp.]